MRFFVLFLFYFISCSPAHDEGLVVYFEDEYTDDGPFGFPNFLAIENKEPDLIYQFENIKITRNLFSKIEKAIENASAKSSKFSIESYKVNPIYLMFADSTKDCFFNSSNDFYNNRGEHLFVDINLATKIRSLIHYNKILREGIDPDTPPPLYYKVVLHVEK